jgi:hypothetical protein
MKNYVVTWNYKTKLRSKCINIDGEWYIKGKRAVLNSGEAYKVGSKWYLADQCYYNTERNLYCKLTANIKDVFENGVIVKKRIDNSYINLGKYYIKSFYDIPKGYSYDINNKRVVNRKTGCLVNYNEFNLDLYGANDNSAFEDFWNEYQKRDIKNKCKELKDYTFGVEFETSYGSLDYRMCKEALLIPVKDGSIGGYEYITVPLKHELDTLQKACFFLRMQCDVDFNTSTHIHIGNLPKDKAFALAFYMLYYRMQNEINSIFPPCKKSVKAIFNKNKKKDHCEFLPELNLFYGSNYVNVDGTLNHKEILKGFNKVWTFWNDGVPPNHKSNPDNRKHIRNGQAKWNILSRYHIINMVPYFFSDIGTIEFRYHEGTTDFGKISNWLFICISCLEYTKNNIKTILANKTKITFEDILTSLENEDLKQHLMNYIITRKELMIDSYSSKNDFVSFISKDQKFKAWQKIKEAPQLEGKDMI